VVEAGNLGEPKGDVMSVQGWRAVGLGLCALLAVDHGVARAQVGIAQSNQKKTIDCGGQEATVTGSLNEITFTGECPSVTIKGSENTVAIEAVGQIRVVGTKNKVTWQRSTVDQAPKITRSGLGNVVSKAAAKADASAGKAAGKSAGAASGATAGARPTTDPTAPAAGASGTSSKAASGPAIVVADEKSTRTIECRGRGVTVMGNGNSLTLRGTCPRVDVKGNENIIGVETVQAIAMTGNHNRVTWTRAAEGEQPTTSDLGNGNAIRHNTAALP
jgi:Protein of unknown function (DUF3060)